MSIKKKLKAIRASRWVAVLIASMLAPLAAGCSTLENAAMFWGLGYAHELLFTPLRAMVGTGLLNFINTH